MTSNVKIQNDNNKAKLLEAFWKLAEFQSTYRLEGVTQINSYLNQLNHTQKESDKQHDDLNYILMRLIRGLASNRKCARLGFSCALTDLLTNNNQIKFEAIVKLADKELNIENQQQQQQQQHILTNEELRNIQIGYAFVYLCLIQSNRESDLVENIDLIIEKLELKRKSTNKIYIKQLYLETLIILIKKFSNNNNKLFEKKILPKIIDELNFGWSTSNDKSPYNTKDSLHLLLACLNTFPKVIEEKTKIEEHWQNKNLLVANENKLYEFISACSESLPKLNTFCVELFTYAIKNFKQNDIETFWNSLIDTRLCLKKDLEKKCLTFNIWLFSIQQLDNNNANLIQTLASKNICSSFINNYIHVNTNLHLIVRQQVAKELIIILKEKEILIKDTSIACELAIKFMNSIENFNELADLISSLTNIFNLNGLNKFYNYLIKHLTAPVQADINDETFVFNKQLWLLNQLSSFSKNQLVCDNRDLLKNILEFLILNIFFSKIDDNTVINDGVIERNLISNKKLSNKIDQHLKEILFKYIGFIITKNDINLNQSVFDLFKLIDGLFSKYKSNTNYKLNEKYIKKFNDYKQLWSKIATLMSKIVSDYSVDKKSNDDDVTLNQTFFMIATFEALRMLDSYQDSLTAIEDLEIAYDKSKVKSNEKNSNKKKKQESITNVEGMF